LCESFIYNQDWRSFATVSICECPALDQRYAHCLEVIGSNLEKARGGRLARLILASFNHGGGRVPVISPGDVCRRSCSDSTWKRPAPFDEPCSIRSSPNVVSVFELRKGELQG